jgi:transposase InsO family protein
MPWQETSPVDQRERFIRDHRLDLYTMVELCTRYGVSRKTGYKWLDRFDEEGRQGLGDRSRAPHRCPHRIPADVAAVICAARRQHPSWGPAKLLAWLRPRHAALDWPAADQHTRDLLACHGLLSTKGHGVRPVFDRLFRDYGLPRAIRPDNGVPFATTGIHGLSQLNVWWLRLGIQHQRILPAQPQQNGAHERMHKPLKGDAIRPPRSTLVTQQRAFTAFRRLYNDERPHEALQDRPPATLYRPSPRAYSGALPPVDYPGHFLVKRVTNAGTIRLRKRLLFIANALKQHPVGLEEVDDGIRSIHFCHVLLGRVDERDYIIRA